MKNGEYEITWLNCRTGETVKETVTVTDGSYVINGKPDEHDWAISAEYIRIGS